MITGEIVGVGAARKVAAVRWNVVSDVVIAWVLTMPAAALIGSVFYELGVIRARRGTGLLLAELRLGEDAQSVHMLWRLQS